MANSENPKSLSGTTLGLTVDGSSIAVVDHDEGRPPDIIPQVSFGPTLERLSSPLALEDQRFSKPETVNQSDLPNQVPGVQGASPKISYARMVAGDIGSNNNFDDIVDLTPDKVIVRDEDCVIDHSGEYPTIAFSDHVHDQIDQCMRQTIIVRLLGRNIGYQTLLNRIHALWKLLGEEVCPRNEKVKDKAVQTTSSVEDLVIKYKNAEGGDGLYGPWMMVDNRRRRPANVGRDVRDKQLGSAGANGSRFYVLNVDDIEYVQDASPERNTSRSVQVMDTIDPNSIITPAPVITQSDEVVKSTAYRASNPTKKSHI
ncbi:hypothetical protein V6N11_014387, partial [Hibiscus sabdariffa]